MPASPDDGVRLAARVTELYGEAELALLARIANRLGRGTSAPDWAIEKLNEVGTFRRRVQDQLAHLDSRAADELMRALQAAWQRGSVLAGADLAPVTVDNPAVQPKPAASAGLRRIAQETLTVIRGPRPACCVPPSTRIRL